MQRERRPRQPHSSTQAARPMQGQTTLVLASLSLAFSCLASGTTDVATSTKLMEVKRDNAELKEYNTELKKEIADLRLLVTKAREDYLRQSMTSCCRENARTSRSLKPTSDGGATYIRWGRTLCPAESILIYKGYVGGSFSGHTGAGTNNVCLPEDPQYNTTVLPGVYSQMAGAEYESFNVIFQSPNQDQNVPCAVCRSPTRSSAIMIPARTSCYPGFHLEYSGYLMAGYPDYAAGTEYICVDQDAESVPGGDGRQNGVLLYFTVSRCASLKCPPYEENRVLSCVVCSQ